MFENPKEREEKFKKLMGREGLDKKLPELPVFAVRYYPASKEKPYRLQDFKTKAERDRWYKEVGENIERIDGGKMEFYEELASDSSLGE